MGKFFNQVVMPLKKIPLNQTSLRSPLEKMRRNFNEENKPELTPKEKRIANLAKAREAKKRKAETNA